MEDAVLTVKELASRWHLSTTAIYRMIHDGSLEAKDLGRDGRRSTWRVRLTDVIAYEEER